MLIFVNSGGGKLDTSFVFLLTIRYLYSVIFNKISTDLI